MSMPFNGAEAGILSDLLVKYVEHFHKKMPADMVDYLLHVATDCKLVELHMTQQNLTVDSDGRVIHNDDWKPS